MFWGRLKTSLTLFQTKNAPLSCHFLLVIASKHFLGTIILMDSAGTKLSLCMCMHCVTHDGSLNILVKSQDLDINSC